MCHLCPGISQLGTRGSGAGASELSRAFRDWTWSVPCCSDWNRRQLVVGAASFARSARWSNSDDGKFRDAQPQELSRSRCVEDRYESRVALLSNDEFIPARRAIHAHSTNSPSRGVNPSERGGGTWSEISEGVSESHQHRVGFSRGVGNLARAGNASRGNVTSIEAAALEEPIRRTGQTLHGLFRALKKPATVDAFD